MRFPLALVKFDAASGEPARDAQGRAIRCASNETGEAIGLIGRGAAQAGSGGEFEGYTSAAETQRKILRDVFEPGDAWYRTGDLMRRDEQGFYYFVDRIGDTFRWKGENVATAEVEDALVEFPGIAEAAVYGVTVRGAEGKAGMAALAADGTLDLAGLRSHLARRLPTYARPLFLRLTASTQRQPSNTPPSRSRARDSISPLCAIHSSSTTRSGTVSSRSMPRFSAASQAAKSAFRACPAKLGTGFAKTTC